MLAYGARDYPRLSPGLRVLSATIGAMLGDVFMRDVQLDKRLGLKQPPSVPPSDPRNHLHLTIFIVITVLLALGLYIFIDGFIFDLDTQLVSEEETGVAYLSARPDKDVYRIGQEILIDFRVAADRPIAGADVIFTYDPTFLRLVSDTPEASQEFIQDSSGTTRRAAVFNDFPYAQLSSVAPQKSQYAFSAVLGALESFQGGGSVAVLRFEALRAGQTNIEIVSRGSSASDSNVAYEGEDILKSVRNATIAITN